MAAAYVRGLVLSLVVAALHAQAPTPPAPTAPAPIPPPVAAPVDPVPVLDGATFAQHWQHIVPRADEMAWREIPWLGALAEAVVQAHAQDKPILLWAMNGHPLACT